MTSWWSGGLGNITGQFTSFAKDVLTEGTEEVDDHGTALKMARERINELESQCTLYKGEYEKAKARLSELHDSLHSAELQLKTTSAELRNVVMQKEAESALAKQKYNELNAVNERLLSEQVALSDIHHTKLTDGLLHNDYASDSHPASHYQRLHAAAAVSQRASTSATASLNSYEVDDVVLAQQEIDRLRAELQRQQRSVPVQRQQQTNQDNSVQLHLQQVADLQAQLKALAENHQHELVTLQDIHAKRLAEIKRAAQQQVADLEGDVASLQAQLAAAADSSSLRTTGSQTEAPEGRADDEPLESPPEGCRQSENKHEPAIPNQHNGTSPFHASQHIPCCTTSVGVQTLEAGIAANDEMHDKQRSAQLYSHPDDSLHSSSAHLEAQVASLQAEVAVLQSRLDSAVEARSTADGTRDLTTSEDNQLASSLREENESLRLSLDELDRQHEEATASMVLIREELALHNRYLTLQLQEKQSALEDAIAKQQLSERECVDLQARLSSMEEQADEESVRLHQAQTANLDLRKALEELEAKATELQDRLEASADTEKCLSDRYRSLEAAASRAEEEHANSLSALRADLERQRASCAAWAVSATRLVRSLLPGDTVEEAEIRPVDLEELSTRAAALMIVNSQHESEPSDAPTARQAERQPAVAEEAAESAQRAGRAIELDQLAATSISGATPASDADADAAAVRASWLAGLDHLRQHVSTGLDTAGLSLLAELDRSRHRLASLPCLRSVPLQPRDRAESVLIREGAAGEVGQVHQKRASIDEPRKRVQSSMTAVAGCGLHAADHAADASGLGSALDDAEKQLTADVATLVSAAEAAIRQLTEQQTDVLEQLVAAVARAELSAAALVEQREADAAAAWQRQEAEQSDLLAQREAELERMRSELAARDGCVQRLRDEVAELELRLADASSGAAQASEQVRALGAERDALLLAQQQMQQLTGLVVVGGDDSEALPDDRQVAAGHGGSGRRDLPLVASERGSGSDAFTAARRHGAERPPYASDDDDDGEDSDSRDAVSDEIKEMRKIIGEKDRVIGELRSTNGGLLRLLDGDHSAAAVAMASASAQSERVRELDERLRAAQAELQHTADSLGSVTQENRALRAELSMAAAAAATGSPNAAAAAGRSVQPQTASQPTMPAMSRDDHDTGNDRVDDDADDDEKRDSMSREAVRKLANIIRDKDLEIEALKQKSATLLAVLQEAGSGGGGGGGSRNSDSDGRGGSNAEGSRAELAAALQERDHLATQVGLFQADREQLYVALRQKHDEASAYYAEAHRLQTALAGALSERDAVRQDLAQVTARLDERQRELSAVGSELRVCKLKLFDSAVAASSSAEAADQQPAREAAGTDGSGESGADSSSDGTVALSAFDAKCQEVTALKEKVRHQREAHLEKDRLVAELSGKVHQLETAGIVREQEAAQLHQQLNRVRFELDSCRAELEEQRSEVRQLSSRAGAHDSEAELLHEHNRKLLLLVREKESELRHAQERADSLEKLLQEKQRGASAAAAAEESGLLAMCEAARRQALEVGQERDQAMLALQQRQAECQQLAAEVQACRTREKKVTTEAERLRAHLLRVEEGYTREALEAEEREKDLRNRLLAAEEKAYSSSAIVQAANADNQKKIESLYEQLHVMASQRDNTLMQLASAQEQAHHYGQQLSNLQMVLEQFQRERDAWHAAEIDKLHRQLDEKVRELLATKASLAELQNRAVEQAEALEAAARLSQQLDRKEEALTAMRQEVQMREQSLCEAEERIMQLTKANESRVDKQVIRSLMLGYLSVANNKRSDVLRLIAGVLEFSHEECAKVGLSEKAAAPAAAGSWLPLSSFWRRGGSSGSSSSSSPASTPAKTRNADGSFSELFVKFLETESSPAPPQARLPVDRMIEEERRRLEVSRQTSAATVVNPFRLPPVTGLATAKGSNSGGSGSNPVSSLLVADLPLTRGFTGHTLITDSPLLLSGSPVPALVTGAAGTTAAVVPASRQSQTPSDTSVAAVNRLTPVTIR